MTRHRRRLRSRPSSTRNHAIHSRTILLAALLCLAGSVGCRGGSGGGGNAGRPVHITVVTYNIHHAAGTDGKLDLPRIARVIRACEPDLVALQEVDVGTKRSGGVDQAAELATLTQMYVVFAAAMPYDGGQYGNALLSRWPIKSRRVVELPWTPGERREPRCAVAATVAPPGKGGAIEFISTHFDHTRDSPDRLPQATAVNSAFGPVRHPGLRPMILAGDFNCEAGSPPMEELGREWMLVSGTDPAAPTCCGAEPKVKIDHVLVQPGKSARWRVIESRVIDERVASDHRPVLVKLQFAP